MAAELETFYELVKDIEVAMLVTRRADGHLQSRAMATQKRAAGADLWFVTAKDTAKVRDLEADPRLNLSYYDNKSREWVSVSGTARLVTDREKIRELYATDWKIWFQDEGDPRHGTADDPRLLLIGVDIESAVYLEVDKPKPVVLFQIAKGLLTDATPELGETHRVTP
jgi:general stress protein 26